MLQHGFLGQAGEDEVLMERASGPFDGQIPGMSCITPNHNLTNNMAHLWIDLGSFAREMIAAFLIGRYLHVCSHAHFAPAGVQMEPAGWVLLWP